VCTSRELSGAEFVERFDTNGTVTVSAISSTHLWLLAAPGERRTRIDIGTRRGVSTVGVGFRVACLAFEDSGGLIVVGEYWTFAVYDDD
jgi:hypothetical protein